MPFLRNIVPAGLLIPLAATLAALTLLPVLLATVGPRLDWLTGRQARRDLGRGAPVARSGPLGDRGDPPPLAGHPGRAGRAPPLCG